ncbi:hypothetical protein SAMN06298221_108172 [Sphaerochaeta associata]|jgi:hypothetical protein|nr:hypothetical protein SAMN06298221_108172 [Sphaerochaeta associata]
MGRKDFVLICKNNNYSVLGIVFRFYFVHLNENLQIAM